MNYKQRNKRNKAVVGGGIKHIEKLFDEKSGCVVIVTTCDPKMKIKLFNGR